MTDDTSTLLSANIKRLREEAGLSQKALAEQSGVPRPTIAHLESGQANPTLSVVLKVAAALGVGVDGLVAQGDSPVVVLSARTLPTERSSRVRRVQFVAAGALREPKLERVVVKAASRIHVAASPTSPAAIVCERGEFTIISAQGEFPLAVESVAHLRTDCDCLTVQGGVLYVASSRSVTPG